MESGYMYMTDTLKTAGALWDYTCRAPAVTHHDKTKKHAFFLCIVFGLHSHYGYAVKVGGTSRLKINKFIL